MLLAPLAKSAAAQTPAFAAPWQRMIEGAIRIARQTIREAEFIRSMGKEVFGASRERSFPGPIDQCQPSLRVKREHRNIDLGHHRSQQSGGFNGVQPLLSEVRRKGVDLRSQLRQSASRLASTRTRRKISLADCGNEVRKRLEGKSNAVMQRRKPAGHEQKQNHRQRPADAGRMAVGPKKYKCGNECWHPSNKP